MLARWNTDNDFTLSRSQLALALALAIAASVASRDTVTVPPETEHRNLSVRAGLFEP